MLELDHLTVSGDVTFGKGVSLKVSRCMVLYSLDLRGEAGNKASMMGLPSSHLTL